MGDSEFNENDVVRQFDTLYPAYDYSLETSYHEKKVRKKKRMKTTY